MNTSDKNLRRYLEKNYGLRIRRVTKIKHGMLNRNYRVLTEQGDFLFKNYLLRTPRETAYELTLLEALRQADFPCPRIFRDLRGALQVMWRGRPGVLFGFIPGKSVKRLTPAHLKRVGAQLGRMHQLLKNARLPSVKRDQWGFAEVARLIRTRRQEIVRKNFPDGAAMVEFIAREFSRLKPHDHLPQGITHQDVKPENIIRDDAGRLSFIDFDNAYRGALLTDLATTVIWTCFPGGKLRPALLRVLLKGYESERKLTRAERAAFAEVMKFRLLREAFAWPLRFAPAKAIKNNSHFLAAYRDFGRQAQSRERPWK
ncbi:MAG: homoserine kinase [Patescibacteria group bacterium]